MVIYEWKVITDNPGNVPYTIENMQKQGWEYVAHLSTWYEFSNNKGARCSILYRRIKPNKSFSNV